MFSAIGFALLTDYDYKQNIIIIENSNANLVDYPISFWFKHGGYANSECSDILLVNTDPVNAHLIDYGLRNCNSSHVEIATKIHINALGTNNSLYVYYGNNTIVNFANKSWNDVRYNLWDDFDSDGGKWTPTVDSYDGGSVINYVNNNGNGWIEFNASCAGCAHPNDGNDNLWPGWAYYTSNQNFKGMTNSTGDLFLSGIIEVSVNLTANGYGGETQMYANDSNYVSDFYNYRSGYFPAILIAESGNGNASKYNTKDMSNTWYNRTMIVMREKQESNRNATDFIYQSYNNLTFVNYSIRIGAWGPYDSYTTTTYDWVRFRYYTNPEPTIVVDYTGAPESQDTEAPQYWNITVTDSINDYTHFNSTWNDTTEIDEVIFEFNGVNYSYKNGEVSGPYPGGSFGQSSLVDMYLYGIPTVDLVPGTYSYRWCANDTSNNWNCTEYYNYEISKINTSLLIHLAINGTQANCTFEYGSVSNVSAWKDFEEGNLFLYRNGIEIETLNDYSIGSDLQPGIYNYTVYYPETENYTEASITKFLNIISAIDLRIEPNSQTIVEGSNASYQITVENTGLSIWNKPRQYLLNITGVNNICFKSGTCFHPYGREEDYNTTVYLDIDKEEWNTFDLIPGESKNITVKIEGKELGVYNISADAFIYSDPYSPNKNNVIEQDRAFMITTILDSGTHSYGVNLISDKHLQIVDKHEIATYLLNITNLGDVIDTFDLIVDKNPRNANVDINPTTIKVEPNETGYIEINISASDIGAYPVWIKVTSQSDLSVSDAVQTVTIIKGKKNSNVDDSSEVEGSAIDSSSVNSSKVSRTFVNDSLIIDSTITDAEIISSNVTNTNLNNVKLINADVEKGYINSGNITIENLEFNISDKTSINNIISRKIEETSITVIKDESKEFGENVKVSIIPNKKYSGGNLKIIEHSIPSRGAGKLSNSLNYFTIEASDNILSSLNKSIVKIPYSNKENLKVYYYNEDLGKWEDISITIESNYVEFDTTHFSQYVLTGTEKEGQQPYNPPSGGGGGGGAGGGVGGGSSFYIGDTSDLTANIGQYATASFTIYNKMPIKITDIRISVSGIPSNWYTLSKTSISSMEMLTNEPITMRFNIPADAEAKNYTVSITVTGKTSGGMSKSDTKTFILTVEGLTRAPETTREETLETTEEETGIGPTGLMFGENETTYLGIAVVGLACLGGVFYYFKKFKPKFKFKLKNIKKKK